jgi:hypothetical protein
MSKKPRTLFVRRPDAIFLPFSRSEFFNSHAFLQELGIFPQGHHVRYVMRDKTFFRAALLFVLSQVFFWLLTVLFHYQEHVG